jgi:ComEC/Rec2-related protein
VAIGLLWLAGIFLGSFITMPQPVFLIGAGMALILCLLLWRYPQERTLLLLLFCLLAGAWRYSFALPANTPHSIAGYIGAPSLQIRGEVADEPKLQGRSRTLLIAVKQVSSDGASWQEAAGTILVYSSGTTIETPYGANYGDSVKLQGKLQAPEPHSAPGVFASMTFPRISVQGTGGNILIVWLYHLRVLLANIIAQALPQPEAALLIALLLSLRTPALSPLIPAFNATGTAHLIAPSGFKVTILAGIIGRIMSLLEKASGSKHRGASSLLRWITTVSKIAIILVYTLLSGAGPAALRAGIMGILLVVAPRTGRTYNIYTSLSLAAIIISAIDPMTLWSVSFLLSFLGTLGIVILTPFFERLLHPIQRLPFGHTLVEIVAVTLAAQVATSPITTIVFQQLSFIALLANVLTVPLLGTFLVLGLLVGIGGLIFLPLGMLCGWLAWPFLWYLKTVIDICADTPGAAISLNTMSSAVAWGYYIALTSLCIILWHKRNNASEGKRRRGAKVSPSSRRLLRTIQLGGAALIILGTGVSALTPQNNGKFSISFLDVGPARSVSQGEAIFIRTAEGQTVLIDGGLDTASLSQALDSRLPSWQRTLDAVVLTTARPEHITGLLDVIQRFQIKEVIDAGMLHPNTTYALWRRIINERNLRYLSVSEGTTIPIGAGVALQILWPQHLHKGSNEARDNSLIVRVQAPGVHTLLLGAAAQSQYALTGLLMNLASSYLQADIVQIVGAINKTYPTALQDVLRKAHPAVLIITPPSVRANQSNGSEPVASNPLPTTETTCQVIQTAQTGTVEIESNAEGWNMNIL